MGRTLAQNGKIPEHPEQELFHITGTRFLWQPWKLDKTVEEGASSENRMAAEGMQGHCETRELDQPNWGFCSELAISFALTGAAISSVT